VSIFGLDRLLRSRGGNISMMYALIAPALVFGAGAALDYGRAAQIHTKLNAAADAAALAALTPAMLQQSAAVAQAAANSRSGLLAGERAGAAEHRLLRSARQFPLDGAALDDGRHYPDAESHPAAERDYGRRQRRVRFRLPSGQHRQWRHCGQPLPKKRQLRYALAVYDRERRHLQKRLLQ
jgi:hypothetical protein